nr:MAG TPA: YvrJ protein family protein [Caudoviricetes sp.]
MITGKNLTKLITLIISTALMQIEVIQVKGHWITGGNVAFPFLIAILLWYMPKRAKEFMGSCK